MATFQPEERDRRMGRNGVRWIAIGLPLIVIGVVLALLLNHNSVGIGVAIAVLGAIPAVVGLVLLGSSGVERWSRRGKPFA